MPYKKETIPPLMLGALQAAYNAAERDASATVTHYNGRPVPVSIDKRGARLLWAYLHLGRKVESFADLTRAQGGYLLDILNGNRTKLDEALDTEFDSAGVRDRRAWFDEVRRYRAYSNSRMVWKFKHDFEHLDYTDKYHLLNVLKQRTRQPAFA